ncbi:MAG: transcription antitermination factor NusB [Gemmatimonadales bacterium]
MLRAETKTRARALQLLYAWEMRGGGSLESLTADARAWNPRGIHQLDAAQELASDVAASASELDREIAETADNWRLERIGAIERNILRIGLHELHAAELPAPVCINEAVRLAHWFAGSKAPAFVNGVLDTLARRLGRL